MTFSVHDYFCSPVPGLSRRNDIADDAARGQRRWPQTRQDRLAREIKSSIHRATTAWLIGASSFALSVCAALHIQSAEAATSPAKFIPTFLVYYGGGPVLVSTDAQQLAKYDLIDIDRFRYNNIGSNTWAAIKSLNPGAQIYLYEMGPEAPNYLDSSLPLYLNGLGRYNVSRGNYMGSLNGNHPELFLPDSAGNRIYSTAFSNPASSQYWHLMDFGSTAYQTYWLTAAKADIVDQPWVADGIFVDNCLTLANAGGYSATPAAYPSNAAWSGAMNSFAASLTAGMHGYGQKIWCNRGGTSTVDGSAAWLALDASSSPPDVVLEEGVFAVQWGGGDTQFFPEADWKRQLDTMAAIRNSKVAMMSHTKLSDGMSGIDNWGKPVTFSQTLWYSLGSFLLGKNDTLGNAYFMFNGGSGYNKLWWFSEYDNINLGKALGPYIATTIAGVNIYSREFENGYVYVNPTPNNVASITLPQASRQLTANNLLTQITSVPNVGAIALNSHNAAILVKIANTTPTDTTAPSVPTGLTGTAVSSTQINLSWNASTDNVGVKGYYVYLNDVALTTTTTTSFQHTGLTPGQTCNYRVSAFDAVPNHSAWTAAPVAVTTPAIPVLDTTAPSVPTGLNAVAASPTQINLSWNPSTDNVGVKGYYVYLNDVALTTTTATSFQHTGLTPGITYNYRVSAYDAVPNHSAWTATPVTVLTQLPPDATPPTVSVTSPAAGSSVTGTITVSATASDNRGVAGVQFKYNGINLGTEVTAAPYLVSADTRTVPNGWYTLTAVARDAAGNLTTSAPVSIKVRN